MTTTADLVARSGDLKRELVEYAQQPRYHRAFREALLTQDLSVVADDKKLTMFMDHFVLQYRLRNGKTVVEQFVTAHPDLPEAERELLLGWRDVVEGIFEVQRRDGDTLLVDNLIDDLTYRVHSSMGPAVFRRMPRRSFLITRLVPIGNDRTDTPAIGFNVGSDLVDSDTVGVIYDEVEGLNFYAEFGLVEAVFADPTLLRRRLYKQRLLDYLDDDTVSPLPFRRLADRDPDRASVCSSRTCYVSLASTGAAMGRTCSASARRSSSTGRRGRRSARSASASPGTSPGAPDRGRLAD